MSLTQAKSAARTFHERASQAFLVVYWSARIVKVILAQLTILYSRIQSRSGT